jgi:hypothetical protein
MKIQLFPIPMLVLVYQTLELQERMISQMEVDQEPLYLTKDQKQNIQVQLTQIVLQETNPRMTAFLQQYFLDYLTLT